MYKNDNVTRRHSESFKLQILSELSTGKYTKRELGRIYNIQNSTINEWIKKYDRKDLMNTRVIVKTKDDLKSIAEYIRVDSVRYAKLQVIKLISRTHILKSHQKSGRVVPESDNEQTRNLLKGIIV